MPGPVLSGRPVPLPIPAGRWPASAATTHAAIGLGPLVERLSRGSLAAIPCNLDPDIDRARLPRAPGWLARRLRPVRGGARPHRCARRWHRSQQGRHGTGQGYEFSQAT
jgi:hypothetical protein